MNETPEQKFREYKRLYPDMTREDFFKLLEKENEIHNEVKEKLEQWRQKLAEIRTAHKETVEEPAKKKVVVKIAFDLEKAVRQARPLPLARDHLGNEYRNREEMCRAWGISSVLFHSRDGKGWSVERILTTPVRKRRTTKQKVLDDLNQWRKKKHV